MGETFGLPVWWHLLFHVGLSQETDHTTQPGVLALSYGSSAPFPLCPRARPYYAFSRYKVIIFLTNTFEVLELLTPLESGSLC